MNTTQWILISAAFLLAAWDVYAGIRLGYQQTISYDLLTDASKRPIVAFALGVVVGHLFWPQPGNN